MRAGEPYFAPLPRRTTGIVRRRIRRSNQSDQLSMYSRSRRTHSLEIPDVVAAADLPQAGQAGLHAQAAAVGEVVETAGFIDRERAGADEAHFAAEHVEELGELIEAELAKPASDAG
jgi:hypothetical protein